MLVGSTFCETGLPVRGDELRTSADSLIRGRVELVDPVTLSNAVLLILRHITIYMRKQSSVISNTFIVCHHEVILSIFITIIRVFDQQFQMRLIENVWNGLTEYYSMIFTLIPSVLMPVVICIFRTNTYTAFYENSRTRAIVFKFCFQFNVYIVFWVLVKYLLS